ncbi:MAG: hypothetical protein JNG90_04335, partial [Planctomycetaceae bacterium]|nr:hypothetical protein [Planctomycetaceae bacterium]
MALYSIGQTVASKQSAGESLATGHRGEPFAEPRPAGIVAARFDPPHPMRVAEANPPANRPAPNESEPASSQPADGAEVPLVALAPAFAPLPLEGELREQLERQAGELTLHLREEVEHIDRREAQLHARIAELEQQLRSAVLEHREEQAELECRRAALEQRARDLDARAAAIAGAERFLDAARLDVECRLARTENRADDPTADREQGES